VEVAGPSYQPALGAYNCSTSATGETIMQSDSSISVAFIDWDYLWPALASLVLFIDGNSLW